MGLFLLPVTFVFSACTFWIPDDISQGERYRYDRELATGFPLFSFLSACLSALFFLFLFYFFFHDILDSEATNRDLARSPLDGLQIHNFLLFYILVIISLDTQLRRSFWTRKKKSQSS